MGEDTLSLAGNRYVTIFVILFSRYVIIFLHRKKSDFPEILRKAIIQAGKAPKILRTDNAGEYTGAEAEAIYNKHGIKRQYGNPYQQFQNGVPEKLVDTINKGTRTSLTTANLPKSFWGFAAINFVDVYNNLPHSSLGNKSPVEIEKGKIPDVSRFRPWGCRATVYVAEIKNHIEHGKLSPRGEACIYLGQGNSRGFKGWICFNPATERLYCTRHVVFDETFMPARDHDQRIMGHYDPTPRQRMVNLIHGSLEAASQNADELQGLPIIDSVDLLEDEEDEEEDALHPGRTCGRDEHQEADGALLNDDESTSFAELNQRQRPGPSSASGGNSARASGGKATSASGGNSAQASGGTSTKASGGKSAQASGGKAKQPQRRDLRHSGGANSGISNTLLTAGEDAVMESRQMSSTNMSSDAYSQADFRGSVVYNSSDMTAWRTIGNLILRDCNNGDLVEWMIGHDIAVVLLKRFWTSDKIKRDLRATVQDTFEPKGDTHRETEVIVLVEEPNERGKGVSLRYTEILISKDPTVDGSKEIHRNCLREAIMDTYPEARKNAAKFTLQNLLDASYEFELNPSGKEPPKTDKTSEPPSSDEEDGSEDEEPEAGPSRAQAKQPPKGAAAPKATEHKSKAGKRAKRAEKAKDPDKPSAKRARNNNSYALHASRTCRNLITETQAFFGVESNATNFKKISKKQDEFRMRNDTEGASFAAYFATIQVISMAAAMGYQAEFLPLEPKNQREARKRPDAERWRIAEIKEQDTLWNKGTFELVDRPSNYDPIPMQFVYKLKVKDGDYDKGMPKARLVMMGNLQYDYEYGDTYAPTARLWVVRALAAIAAQEGLTMKKFDLTGAFLNADMDRTLHVQIPGYDIPKDKALLLKKALYGGRSSGALYAKEIRAWLEGYGFVACSVDETLFRLTRTTNNKTSTLLISLYVDDGACCTNDEKLYQDFITALQDKYELSDVGDMDWHLGINVKQDLVKGTISFDQTSYIESVVKRFNMAGCKPKYTPLPPKIQLTSQDCPATPIKKDVKVYQQLLGSLMYVACGTRPDVAFAVNSCAQFMQNPGESHFKAAKHILRYLNTTKDAKLTYSKQPVNMANVLYGFVDADHAGSTEDRKSVGGYVLLLNGAAISWSSRKIKVVALSSFESEWYSASICGCEVVVVRRLLEEMQREQTKPTKIFEDNAACIQSATDTKGLGSRSRHIDTRMFKLREFVKDGILSLEKVCSAGNVADCLTKALPREQVELARDAMLGNKR